LWRDRRESTVRVRVVELKEAQTAVTGRAARPAPVVRKPNQLGLTIRPLAPQEKAEARTDGTLVVEGVSGAAEVAGVETGDIILGVDGRRIRSVEELESAANGKRNKSIALLVQRGSGQLFLPISVP
jgi:serine protease Do